MRQSAPRDDWARPMFILAQVSCLAFGTGLLAWGFTPVVAERLASHEPPALSLLTSNALTLLFGALFLGLGLLVRQGIAWALWTALVASLFLLIALLAAVCLGELFTPSLFALLLAASTAIASILALGVRRMSASPRPAEKT